MSSKASRWLEYLKYVQAISFLSSITFPTQFLTLNSNHDADLSSLLLVNPRSPQPVEAECPTVNSIAFHRTHDLLVTASTDDGIRLYDTHHGVQSRAGIYSQKYGVANICFGHDPNSVIYSSTKVRGI